MILKNLIAITAQRLWQGIAGLVTVVVVAQYLSPLEQGWYYTFLSVAALYSIFEMGLSAVLLQISANFFTELNWTNQGAVEGRRAKEFLSFAHQAWNAFCRMAIIFIVVAILFGGMYFSSKAEDNYAWAMPWIFLVVFTALNMITLSFVAIIEGSGLVHQVYWVKFLQGFIGAAGCWLCIYAGLGLWAAVAAPAISLFVALLWFFIKWRNALVLFVKKQSTHNFSWSDIVWPMQWRVGLGWVGNYLMSQLSTPIVFYYHGPVAAGQIGLSLTIAHMVGVFSQSWFTQSASSMAKLVATKDLINLNKVFVKNIVGYSVTFLIGAFSVLFLTWLLVGSIYESRILSFADFAGLFIFVFLYQLNSGFALQLRAFNKEPLVWVFLLGGLAIFLASLFFAKDYSIRGVVGTMLFVQVFLISPLSLGYWRRVNIKMRQFYLN